MCQGLQKSQDKHYAVLKHQYNLSIWENILYQNKDIVCVCGGGGARARTLNRVQLFVTPWTIKSMEFSRPEY